jgi:D-alanyl-D-alanine dipeptidase
MNNEVNFVLLKDNALNAFKNDWQKVSVKENGEPLVMVPDEFCHSWYALEMKLISDKRVYLRKTVYDMFLKARTLLPQGYDMKIYDGWRSLELQEDLFWYYLKMFTVKEFGLEKQFEHCVTTKQVKEEFYKLPDELAAKVKSAGEVYVSWPSSAPDKPSVHSTGGAIDVWLYKDGKPENLGVPFDYMGKEGWAFYHLEKDRKPFEGNDKLACKNREMLISVMVKAGFECNPFEIWHFNYGNQKACLINKTTACYSYIKPVK